MKLGKIAINVEGFIRIFLRRGVFWHRYVSLQVALPLKRDSGLSDFFLEVLFLRGHIRCLGYPTATPDLALGIIAYMELWLCQHSNNRKANEIKLRLYG